MKKKDIVVLVICVLIILVALYFIMTTLKPKTQEKANVKSQNTIDFTGEIDEKAIEKLKSRRDYGSPPMDNIGRDNPFASL
ncbi:hypothetical protein C4544_02515 [candidate division WS5 bacterium]|uniref:Uncharacterized protein n=1 Tax=candidate division WS5 bacterium TaxID=2093353 RepID=A0A419DEN3_9BACT|nr:MAG: hypothetical protein C4544_02515 [candidate division WS5 bacterium]